MVAKVTFVTGRSDYLTIKSLGRNVISFETKWLYNQAHTYVKAGAAAFGRPCSVPAA
jgi:hypothetical protein